MGILKSVARNFVFPAITALGLEKAFNSSGNNRLVIMYHGVVKHYNPSLSVNHISLSDFEKHIVYLKKTFNIVSLSEIFSSYRSGKKLRDKKQIAITFDDGYENNFTNAYPILKKHNIPATIFVVSQALRNADFILWYDLLDVLKNKTSLKEFLSLSGFVSEDKRIEYDSVQNIGQLKRTFKKLNSKEKENILSTFRDRYKNEILLTDKEFLKTLSVAQMKEMIDSGLIEIGSHTHNHPNLEEIADEEIVYELTQSKNLLQSNLGVEIKSIAFPDGSYNQKVKDLALKAGYKNLLAVDFRLTDDNSDLNILPRYCISNTTTPESNFIQIHRSFSKIGF